MHVFTVTVPLALSPLALIEFTIEVDQSTLALHITQLPLPLVESAVGPDLATKTSLDIIAASHESLPLTDVDCASVKTKWPTNDYVAALCLITIYWLIGSFSLINNSDTLVG